MKYEFFYKKQLVFSCDSEGEKQKFIAKRIKYDTLTTKLKELHFESKVGKPQEINSQTNFNKPLLDNDEYRAPYRIFTSGQCAEMIYF